MSNGHATIFLHWFWVAFFVLFGLNLIRQKTYLTAGRAACGLSAQTNNERLCAAVERRRDAEGVPPPVGWWTGAFSIVLALIAAFGHVPFTVLYGALCFSLAAAVGAVFLRLRNSQYRRTAILRPRSISSVIPAYWFALAILCGLSILSYATVPGQAVSCALVCVSSLASTAIAWKLTQLPALLSGNDIAAEEVVDARLRFVRSASALVFAFVQTFVFCSQYLDVKTPWQTAAYILNWPSWIAFGIWMFYRMFAQRRMTIAPRP